MVSGIVVKERRAMQPAAAFTSGTHSRTKAITRLRGTIRRSYGDGEVDLNAIPCMRYAAHDDERAFPG
jgi:hypothetical protein